MDRWLTGSARIVYDPHRGKMARRTRWWAILPVDREITRYYRWWLTKELHIKRLFAPAWDAHISIVRGERPHDLSMWKKYQGEVVQFRYSPVVRQAGDTTGETEEKGHFWFVDVWAPRLLVIRNELGLRTHHGFHLTVGRVYS